VRPLRLTVRGFRSYGDEASFDFSERSLVGIVGPIGSGKSSLLDAVSFALYGRTPTVTKETRSLINQRRDAAHVELWFDVDGTTWRAVRALRRKGQSAHALERYRSFDPGSQRLESIEQEKVVNVRIAELLGLDFQAFSRSVLLAQNQFARFLEATAGERNDVLKGVFGLDRIDDMRLAAKTKRDAASRDLEELERRRGELVSDKAALAKAKSDRADHVKVLDRLEQARPEFHEVARRLAAATEAAAQSKVRLVGLKELAAKMPNRKATEQVLARASSGAEAVAKAEDLLNKSATALATVEEELAKTVEEVGSSEDHGRLALNISQATDLARQVARATQQANEALKASTASEEAAKDLAAAAEKADSSAKKADEGRASAMELRRVAETTLHQTRHASMALTLRQGLATGESCPVCIQKVSELPAAQGTPDLSAAEKELEKARQRETKAVAAAEKASVAAATAAERASAAKVANKEALALAQQAQKEAAGAADEHLTAMKKVLVELGGEGDPEKLLASRIKRLETAEKKRADAVAAREAARSKLDAARESVAADASALQRLATEVASLSTAMGTPIEPTADSRQLGEALSALRDLWERESAGAEDDRKEASRIIEDAEAGRKQILKEAGVAPDVDFDQAHQAALQRAAALAALIEEFEKRVGRLASLEKENTATLATRSVYQHLVDDLSQPKFIDYLLGEERVALSELAAERFEMLSDGRYRFSTDGTFDVIDLAAAETTRKARSLSGGETFLASLAMALALAEMVTRQGGRLDAFFLDEGFGSLDADHLELAMDGVERMVASNRLVAVVSHVPELRHRLEDLIELGKDPVTGDTVVHRS